MPHYILVSIDDKKIKSITQAHEHVVQALHGHAKALGSRAQFTDAFPAHQHGGQTLDPAQLKDPYTLSVGEIVHLVAPPGYQLALHQYHSVDATEHHTEVSLQDNDSWQNENGFALPRASVKPENVPDAIVSSWPQHDKPATSP